MKGLNLMYIYKAKIAGIIVSAIGLLGMIGERLSPFVLYGKMSPEQHYSVFLWLTLGGLFVIAYCKEKEDDERAQQIRLKAFQLSFMVTMGAMLAMALTMSLASPVDLVMDGTILFLFAGLAILGYLLTFYTGLYFDRFWDFENKERSAWERIKDIPKNIGGILVYLLVFTIAIVLIMLILP